MVGISAPWATAAMVEAIEEARVEALAYPEPELLADGDTPAGDVY